MRLTTTGCPRPSSHDPISVLTRPFVVPKLTKPVERAQPIRKRKRVSYKEQLGDGDDDDDDGSRKKRKKTADDDYALGENDPNGTGKQHRAFAVKDFDSLAKKPFAIPTMRDKAGQIIPTPLSGAALGIRPLVHVPPRPLYNPMADHAIILYDPTIDQTETDEERKERLKAEEKEKARQAAQEASGSQNLYNPHKSLRELLGLEDPSKKKVITKVPVVIDPQLSAKLRPHQVEGVKFLYKAMTGFIKEGQYGCIMADEMGLGKTMQCIVLLWTLLKQSPRASKPTIEKCIIACPASLVKNWANEMDKWLGKGVLGCLPMDGKGTKEQAILNVRRWVAASGRTVTQPVMIVSYETLRSLEQELAQCEIGLLLCDEGHRLKNSENQTFRALDNLRVQRRVIITGTPIQNDLTEYFSLLNFANPNYLGSKMDFRKNYENAIIRGRDAEATDDQKKKSVEKLRALSDLVQPFIIRRTNDLLSKYLPVKYEHVVFCNPSEFQISLYELFTSSPEIQALLRGKGSQPLKAIDLLRKLCNTPQLLDLPNDLVGSDDLLPEGFIGGSPAGAANNGGSRSRGRNASAGANMYGNPVSSDVHPEYSGKFAVLARFLHRIRTETKDKVVLISNFTQTLDLFEKLCRNNRYGFFRLDGTMATAKRAKIVDRFNDPESNEFVFLLSSKAGGCGINLIGANRLILFDPDWNPASDQQALARVWRDGQKKECFVYRFISTGTIEEKIFQRQASKQALSASVVDQVADGELHFSKDELKKLFLFKKNTVCETHETFKCKRCKNGKQVLKSSNLLYGDASSWNHFSNPELKNNHDDLLRAETGVGDISFVFQYISH